MSKTLIRGGCVLTLGAKTPNYTQADVLIEDGRVAEVGPGLRARDAEVVDATDTIVMPGFVDTHRHTWKSLFRFLGEPGSGGRGSAVAYGHHYQPEDVYAATLIGLLGAVEAGITTVVDWSDIQFDDTYAEAALQAHADAGLRTVFVHAVPTWAEGHEEPGVALQHFMHGRGEAAGSGATIAFGSRRPARSNTEILSREWAQARDMGLRIHAHTGVEDADAGIITALVDAGLLAEDVTLVHCTLLSGPDLDAVSSSHARVSLTPSNEMTAGPGSPPIQELIDRNIRPGLGIDDELLAPGDMFAQMRAAISIQHATHFDLKLAGKGHLPHLLSTRDVIRYATVDGARVAGLGSVSGSLEPGKQADVLVLRTDRPNIFPVNDPIGAVVWGMDTSNIDWVFVGGEALVRNGSLGADGEAARTQATAAQQRVAVAAGLPVGAALEGGSL